MTAFIHRRLLMSVRRCASRDRVLAGWGIGGTASRRSRGTPHAVLRLADFDLCKGCEVCSDLPFPVARVSNSCSDV